MNKDCIIYLIMAFLLAYTHTISAGKYFKIPLEFKSATMLESICCKDSNGTSLESSV